MGRKLQKLTSLLFFGEKSTPLSSPQKLPSWAWPSCKHPRTDSLRFDNSTTTTTTTTTTDSAFTHSSEDYLSADDTLSTTSDDDSETVIRSLERSERLLFEPGGYTSSICDVDARRRKGDDDECGLSLVQFSKESVVVAMESVDPYSDFRRSMEEMVIAHHHHHHHHHHRDCEHDHDDWEWLEELLVWYLRGNEKRNHGFIVGAFVDLLVGFAISNCCKGVNEKMIYEEEEEEEDGLFGDVVSSSSNCMSCISYEIEEDESSGSC